MFHCYYPIMKDFPNMIYGEKAVYEGDTGIINKSIEPFTSVLPSDIYNEMINPFFLLFFIEKYIRVQVGADKYHLIEFTNNKINTNLQGSEMFGIKIPPELPQSMHASMDINIFYFDYNNLTSDLKTKLKLTNTNNSTLYDYLNEGLLNNLNLKSNNKGGESGPNLFVATIDNNSPKTIDFAKCGVNSHKEFIIFNKIKSTTEFNITINKPTLILCIECNVTINVTYSKDLTQCL